jgi:hypothetical protein
MAICQVNDFLSVYAKAIADERQLIGKCDIGIPKKAFSVSFTSSAVRAVVAMHAPRTNVL